MGNSNFWREPGERWYYRSVVRPRVGDRILVRIGYNLVDSRVIRRDPNNDLRYLLDRGSGTWVELDPDDFGHSWDLLLPARQRTRQGTPGVPRKCKAEAPDAA